MNKRLAILFSFLLLQSCANPPLVSEDYEGPTAYLYDTVSNTTGKSAHFFEIDKVDGKGVDGSIVASMIASDGQGMALTTVRESRKIPAGNEMKVKLLGMRKYAAPILEIVNGSFKVHGEVIFAPEPDKTYVVNGELSKEYSAIWIEEQNGKIVTEKIERSK